MYMHNSSFFLLFASDLLYFGEYKTKKEEKNRQQRLFII